jgi:hypothetical protein
MSQLLVSASCPPREHAVHGAARIGPRHAQAADWRCHLGRDRIEFAMAQVFGNEIPRQHSQASPRKAARYLVLIESGGNVVARLFVDTREQVAEFDASTEEVTLMTQGLVAAIGADGVEWDAALAGHSPVERKAARVYTLDV